MTLTMTVLARPLTTMNPRITKMRPLWAAKDVRGSLPVPASLAESARTQLTVTAINSLQITIY
jgi:hypothetical protein